MIESSSFERDEDFGCAFLFVVVVMAAVLLLTVDPLGWFPRPKPTIAPCPPAAILPGPDGSGATGRAGAMQWEVYAEAPELGRVPVQVWVHGPGWSVHCAIKAPGTGTRCVEMKEPARVEGSRR